MDGDVADQAIPLTTAEARWTAIALTVQWPALWACLGAPSEALRAAMFIAGGAATLWVSRVALRIVRQRMGTMRPSGFAVGRVTWGFLVGSLGNQVFQSAGWPRAVWLYRALMVATTAGMWALAATGRIAT